MFKTIWFLLAIGVAGNSANILGIIDDLLDVLDCGGHNAPDNYCCSAKTLNGQAPTCYPASSWVPVGGNLYADWSFHFTPISSICYMCRIARALGYRDCSKTALQNLQITTPWSGVHNVTAIDWANGNNKRNIFRKCQFPQPQPMPPTPPGPTWPFFCTGTPGTVGTNGNALGELSYVSALHDETNHDWNLFINCYNPQTPQKPNRIPCGVAWTVFSLKPTIPDEDLELIMERLEQLNFNTSATAVVVTDYSTIFNP